jgi:hypothetical protein
MIRWVFMVVALIVFAQTYQALLAGIVAVEVNEQNIAFAMYLLFNSLEHISQFLFLIPHGWILQQLELTH